MASTRMSDGSDLRCRLWRTLASPWTGSFGIAALTLIVLLRYEPSEFPLISDRAYFVYLGQLILRGESIYSNTFIGYPALGPLLSAAAMWVAGWFDIPTYLAPRFLSIPLSMLSAVLLYHFTRRALGSGWAGWMAGVLLVGFEVFRRMSVGTLEPKMLVDLFMIAGCLALQRRCWWAAGLATGLASACWPPAIFMIPVTLMVVLWGGRETRAWAGCAAGIAIGILPAVLYLAMVDGWWEFWQRCVVINASAKHPGRDPLRWIRYLQDRMDVFPVFVSAATGFVGFAFGSVRGGLRRLGEAWVDPRLGGLPLLSLVWLGYVCVDFQGVDDLLLIVPATAFWAAWLAHRLLAPIASIAARGSSRNADRSRAVLGCVVALTAWYVLTPAFRFTLPEKRSLSLAKTVVDQIFESVGPNGTVDGFGAEVVFAIANRKSPSPFLRASPVFDGFLHLVDPNGCDGVLEKTLGRDPKVVVMFAKWGRQGSCARRIHRRLVQSGYRESYAHFPQKCIVLTRPKPRIAKIGTASA